MYIVSIRIKNKRLGGRKMNIKINGKGMKSSELDELVNTIKQHYGDYETSVNNGSEYYDFQGLTLQIENIKDVENDY